MTYGAPSPRQSVGALSKSLPPGAAAAPPRAMPAGVELRHTIQDYLVSGTEAPAVDKVAEKLDGDGELDLTGIDDSEIDGYIMTDREIEF